ncbi:uncharacterized protein NEMAJ01_0668 [Nematocida major]|uniref:uncharacterized protein n=1 Tax=Nematocida major TaxID=1912982 RepID=UPI002008E81D|nr:uncharacterized protein NEMAJ01_0668 [Nematocida major]KAH9385772.1 hypothetical protein NEMAJ01_0668 [Nematocida major]
MNHRIVEVKKLRGESRTVSVEADQVVYIADTVESQIAIRGKCMKVVIVDVQKCLISVDAATCTVEIARAKNSLLFVGKCPMTVLEQCVECRVGTSMEKTELRMRRSTALSLVTVEDAHGKSLEELDEICRAQSEEQLPEEIQVLLENGSVKSNIVKNI